MRISTTRRRSGRLGRLLVNALCGATILVALAFIVPTAFGLERYVINGSSMSGSIDLGSVVFAEVVPVSQLEVGDVITYQPPRESGIDHLVTHRIVAIHDDGTFVTKGDANPEVDPWRFRLDRPDQARVTFDVPYVGWVFLTLQDRSLRMLLIGLPALVIALVSLAQLVGALRRQPAPAPGHVRPSPQAVRPVPRPTVPAGG